MEKRLDLRWGLGGFALTLAVLFFAFFVGEMYPFGWGTVSWCDMNQQLIPLFCDFKDILSGKQSLFFNTANGGGMNFYGVFFFFLSSPFSFSVALVEKADIPFLMNILVILKLSLSGFTASWVIKKLNKELNFGTVTALGGAYALCGYGMLFYQNIMWLDIMYLFPFVVLGCVNIIKENKPFILTLSLTACVIMNFYISFMVFLFVIFFFGVFACCFTEAHRKIYSNLAFSGIIPLLLTSVVWVPCLLQYATSARGGGIFNRLKTASFFAPYETTLPIILLSSLIVAGILLFIFKFSVSSREDRFLFAVFVLTSLPLLIEPINLMWHTGSYMSFPARYGFIPVFMGTVLTARLIKNVNCTENSKNSAIYGIVGITLLLSFAIIFAEENSDTLSVYVGSLWGDRYSFKGHLLLCAVFVLCYMLCKILVKSKKISKSVLSVLLCLIVGVQGLTSVQIYMLTAKGRLSLYNYRNIIALSEKAEKQYFYRVNTNQKITDANMTGAAGFNSLGHYTSLNNKTYMETAKKFGLSGYWMETGNWGGSILADAMLSVGYTVVSQNDECSLTENPYFLGLGIKAKGEIPSTFENGDRLTALGESFAKITDTESVVKKYSPTETADCDIYKSANEYFIETQTQTGIISYDVKVNGKTSLYFDCYGGFSNNLVENINNGFAVYVNSEILRESYPTQTDNGLLYLGSFEKETVNITLKVFQNLNAVSFGVFGIDELALKETVDKTETLNLNNTGGKITGEAKEGNYFISIPQTDGLKVTLDGKRLDATTALDGFIAVSIPHSGVLEITLVPTGFYLGLAVSLIGIPFLIWFIKRRNTINEKANNIIYGIFLGGFAIAMASVYVIPIILSLADFKL